MPFCAPCAASAASRPPQLKQVKKPILAPQYNANKPKNPHATGKTRGRGGGRRDILPVVQITVSLGTLSGEVDSVAGEEKIVGRGDGESIAREGSGVDNQGTGHLARDTVDVISALVYAYQGGKEGQKQQSALRVSMALHLFVLILRRTVPDLSVCPSQPQRGYRSWRQGPRSLEKRIISQSMLIRNFCS